MIIPRTVGELVAIIEAGREDEIDPEWREETYQASLEIVRMFMLPKDAADKDTGE